MAEAEHNQVREFLKSVLAPLVAHDGGKLYLVALSDSEVRLHLAGTHGGCPGTPLVIEKVIVPPLRQLAPGIDVVVTRGWQVPEGAASVHAAD